MGELTQELLPFNRMAAYQPITTVWYPLKAFAKQSVQGGWIGLEGCPRGIYTPQEEGNLKQIQLTLSKLSLYSTRNCVRVGYPTRTKNETNNLKSTCPRPGQPSHIQRKLYSTGLRWGSHWAHDASRWVHDASPWVCDASWIPTCWYG